MKSEYERCSKAQLIEQIKCLEQQLAGALGVKGKTVSAASKKDVEEPTSTKKKRKFDFSKVETRFVAFRFAYMGWNYNGLNFQYEPTPLPTVEEEILKAMVQAKLVVDTDPGNCNFSRCGRTDKGVSALNQVISLDVRSALSKDDQQLADNDAKEIPYLTILNAILPTDIRLTAVCLRPPPDFNARFSCTYRHYKYLFKADELDTELMQLAAKKYEGVHDFRNFCKIDGSKQITNHQREVYSANIIHHQGDFFVFDLKGSAFLWHQVRCMIAILFLVGQKLEQPSIVDELTDMTRYPRKPIYEMANDIPLVLYDCVFPEMEWLTTFDDFGGAHVLKLQKEYGKFNETLLDYELKLQIAGMVKDVYVKNHQRLYAPGTGYVNIGDGKGRNFKAYVPISKREVGEDVAVVNERHREKRIRKQMELEAALSL